MVYVFKINNNEIIKYKLIMNNNKFDELNETYINDMFGGKDNFDKNNPTFNLWEPKIR
jgi:hypothetical protein